MALNLEFSCLSLTGSGIISVCYNVNLATCTYQNIIIEGCPYYLRNNRYSIQEFDVYSQESCLNSEDKKVKIFIKKKKLMWHCEDSRSGDFYITVS